MTHQIIHGDCLRILPTLGQYDFIFADPPFNIGRNYDVCYDNKPHYYEWCRDWISFCWERCNGVMCLHGHDNLAEIYLRATRELGFATNRIAWINWHYRFGQCTRANWIDARCHCLVYARPSHKWRPDPVLVPSDRSEVYADARVADTERGGWRLPGAVWGVPSDGRFWGRVQGNSAERRSIHDNQLPEVYLKRLILAYTDEGDNVLDPFGGSGTTITVATGLKRNCTTIELSEAYCRSIQLRVEKGMVRK